jgi:Fe2+ transport system protein FeoA
MGLFGDIDANEVSDNPFYVAPDKYQCVLAEAQVVQKKDGSGYGLSFNWVIEDEESEFNQQRISDWKNIYPDADSREGVDEITIRRDNANLKRRLTEMGLTADEMNDLLDEGNLDELIGMTAVVEVTETPDKKDPDKKWTNIASVTRLDA